MILLVFKCIHATAPPGAEGLQGQPENRRQPLDRSLFRRFTHFLTAPSAVRVITNTLIISLYSLVASFPIPILLAVGLNELRSNRLRKSIQMITYMPYFISTVVLVSMIIQFTDLSYGFVNQAIKALGGQPVNFMGNKDYFRHIYVWTTVWQTTGYSAVVYLAALAGVDRELYDAAVVDGASKVKRILHIDLPTIAPTIIVIFILNTGAILSVGFEKIYLMQNNTNLSVSEVISTYVYRMGLVNQNHSYSTAVGLLTRWSTASCCCCAMPLRARSATWGCGEGMSMQNTLLKKRRNKLKQSAGDRVFDAVTLTFLLLFSAIVAYPLIYVVSASFSSTNAVIAGSVWLWPVEPNLEAYKAVFNNASILSGYKNAIIYTAGSTLLTLIMTVLCGFSLSRKDFFGRNIFSGLILFTMLFSGGLIPTYLLIKDLGMLDTIWPLILPNAVWPWFIILARTYMANAIPEELYESASLDGCSVFRMLWYITLPLSRRDSGGGGAVLRGGQLEQLF